MRKMKDSGIEWIGEIPEDWEVCKLKYLATVQTGNTPSMNNENLFFSREKGIPWIKAENLNTDMSIEKTEQYLTPEGVNEGRLFPKNTIYICCIASIGKVGFSCIEASCNQQINALSFNDKFYWKYGFYLSKAQEEEYLLLASGNVVKILNSERQKNMFCPFPPLFEQQRIADFLDDKVSQIDSVISKTRETIEEYKKLKQSIITEVVTGKVKIENGKVCGKYDIYKDSGVEWIGEIPSEWSVIKCKYLLEVKSGDAIRNELLSSNGKYQVFGGGEILGYTDVYNANESNLLIGRVGARCGCVTRPFNKVFATDNALVVIPKDNRNFLYYVFISFDLNRLNTSNAQPLITSSKVKNITIPVPLVTTQQRIADFLDKKCSEIDKLITKKEQLVVELESYKKSLIYEVVTGKKEMC